MIYRFVSRNTVEEKIAQVSTHCVMCFIDITYYERITCRDYNYQCCTVLFWLHEGYLVCKNNAPTISRGFVGDI